MIDLKQFVNEYASVHDMAAWARSIMESRPPEQTIEDHDAKPYMHRWYIVPRNPLQSLFLHHIVRSDKDVPHDHPWDSTSLILEGTYVEQLLLRDRSIVERTCGPGDIIKRKAEDAHRLVIQPGQPVTTLFFIQQRKRDWGFHCPGGWVHWKDFTNGEDHGRVGRGCGDLA